MYRFYNVPGVRALGFSVSKETFVCESCYSEHASKYTHLLPGKNSWINILHFPNSQTLLLCTDPGSWPDYAVCLFTNNILPISLCSRSLFTVSGVHSRPDDAASSSPGAKTDFSYSATEFTAAVWEFIKALLKNKNKLKNIFIVLPLGFSSSCIIAYVYELVSPPILASSFSF